MKDDSTAEKAENANETYPELSSAELEAATAKNPDSSIPPRHPVDSVMLIDGDNDPHVPPDVHPTRHTLVRVFLRPGAKMPRTLEKKLSHLPHCTTVVSPRGGANAADFVMSLHAGMLHAILPQHIHFLMVTNDATLQAMAAELQRLGRVATIWTSHPDAMGRCPIEARAESEETFEEPKAAQPQPRRTQPGRTVVLAPRRLRPQQQPFIVLFFFALSARFVPRGRGAVAGAASSGSGFRRAAQARREDAFRGRLDVRGAPSAHQGRPFAAEDPPQRHQDPRGLAGLQSGRSPRGTQTPPRREGGRLGTRDRREDQARGRRRTRRGRSGGLSVVSRAAAAALAALLAVAPARGPRRACPARC